MKRNALPPRGTALLLALVAGLLLYRLGAVPLLGPDEPRYARVAVEMHRSGAWVTPTLQGRPWLEKPALYYWLAGMGYALLGETEAAARLPSVAACLLLVGFTALIGARLQGSAAGLHAGFALGTSLLVFVYGRAASMDMLLAFTVTAAIGLFGLRLLGIAGPLAATAAWACMGLATLAKGPLGVVLPALAVGGYIGARRDWKQIRRMVPAGGVLAFLVIAAPWYALVLRAQGREFVDVFLLDHNLQRFSSTIHRHPGQPWYYVPVILGGLFPWSGLLVPALAQLRPRVSRTDLFLLIWLALPLAFFSAAGSKLPGYILPCLPPLALLIGRAADRLARGETAAGGRAVALLTLAVASLLATAPALLWRQGEPQWRAAVPLSAWLLILALTVSRRIQDDAAGALRILRVGAAGMLLLLATAAPPILARRESGRSLFLPARGREVLAWGAWRTAWMAGYFYNDARVREVSGLAEVLEHARREPALLLCGPQQRRHLESLIEVSIQVLAEGPRQTALLKVTPR